MPAKVVAGSGPALRLTSMPGKGRGIVAGRRFAADELVERNPVLVIPADEWASVEGTIVSRFCFTWHEQRGDVALALGFGSLLNHSYAPNLWARTRLGDRILEFVALRDIAEGEELTLNYNPESDAMRPMDFGVRGGRRPG